MIVHRCGVGVVTIALLLVSSGNTSEGAVVRAGFDSNALGANDDGSTGALDIGFDVNFFGATYNTVFLNNNGNLTFNTPLSTYTPFGLTSDTAIPIIAPFFADVDTNGTGSGLARWGSGSVDGRGAFGATWVDVGYYSAAVDKLNSFQVVLIDRSDTGAGNFDIEFNYDKIQWETGDASGGSSGFGGNSARAGYSNGTGIAGTFVELPGSGVNGALLDTGPNSLVNSGNGGVAGRYVFEARNGTVVEPPETDVVPEPTMMAIFGTGAAFLVLRRVRSSRIRSMRDKV